MTTILGVDAAWTSDNPTGVALIQQVGARWRCLAVAPSYLAFTLFASGKAVDWSTSHQGERPNIPELLRAAELIAGERPTIVAIDMPISLSQITERRAADRLVSREYGGRHCSAHSPSALRPGVLGADLSQAFALSGYSIATVQTAVGTPSRLVEVYPHTAILSLLHLKCRLRYKVAKSLRYWPRSSLHDRIRFLLSNFALIIGGLACYIDGIQVELPRPHEIQTLASLKRYEDALDALVCCWFGAEYLAARARAMGDEVAAIWCPPATA